MNKIRSVRRQKNLTQYDLCKKTKIPQSSLSLIERFYKEPTLKMKKRIAKALDSELHDLFPTTKHSEG